MKSKIKRIFLIMLVCAFVATGAVGCSSSGKKMMELDGNELSVNMVMLLMSRMKGTLAASGYSVSSNSFWDTVVDASTGKTNDDYYTELVIDSAKTYLAAMALFDELELELPDSYIEEIDTAMDDLVQGDGEGSKAYLNTILADYGANYKVLREAYIMEAKIAYLSDYLFGADGSKIGTQLYEEYYQENYVRFNHIMFYKGDVLYETDENGDTIYYSDLSNKKIAYDTSKTPKGEKDSNGDAIYVYTDDDGMEHIAYFVGNSSNPSYRSPVLDSDGNMQMDELSEADHKILMDEIQLIMDNEVKAGDQAYFDRLVEAYTEEARGDDGKLTYTNGWYETRSSKYFSNDFINALFEMEVGEVRRLESEYAYHIVMKYELDEGGYAKEENSAFFLSDSGSYTFLSDLKNKLLGARVESYKANIIVKEDLLDQLSMKDVKANYNY